MNCRKARERIPLLAGGDLPPRESGELLRHVERCERCAAALAEARRALAAVGEIAARDLPPPVPADFEGRVRLAVGQGAASAARARGAFRGPWQRLALGGAAVVAAAIVALAVRRDSAPPPVAPVETASSAGTRVGWNELQWDFEGCAEGPYRLADWTLPDGAGVIAVLHKPDPVRRPDLYVVDYCGESEQLSRLRGYPWFEQRIRRFAARAGSHDNLYVVVCRLDPSSRGERRRIERAIVGKYQPFFNVHKGA